MRPSYVERFYFEDLMRLPLVLALAQPVLATPLMGQSSTSTAASASIQDNSFLVEEAYNQERGVVQHINTFVRASSSRAWTYSFTQEWPLGGQRHQIGFTLPMEGVAAESGGARGLGDLTLDYRYQIAGVGGHGASGALAFAPRISLILPTGSTRRGLGSGGGVQVNLPLSVELSPPFVAHSNVGTTYTPRARASSGHGATTVDYTIAQSIVWHALPGADLMIEAVWTRAQRITGPGQTRWSTEALIAPGIRTALDFGSRLQIVPGLAFPIGVGPSRGEQSVFVYLSFEHPFASEAP